MSPDTHSAILEPEATPRPHETHSRPEGRTPEHRVVFWMLAALLLALPTVILPASGPWLAAKAFVLEAVAIVLAVLVFSRGEWTAARALAAFRQPVNLAVLAFLVWIGISAAMAELPRLARYEALRHLGGGLVYFAALYGLSARRQLDRVLWLLAGVGSLSAVAAFLNAGETDVQRIAGAFHNQQLLAGFLCLLFPLVLVGSQAERETWPRLGMQVAVVVVGAGILVTQNRSAWFGAAAGLILVAALYLLFGRERGVAVQKAQVILPLVIVALTVGLFLAMSRMSGSLSQRAGTLSALANDQSFQWRLGMWDKAARMIRDRPLTGWGVGSFPVVQAQYPHPAVTGGRTQIEIVRTGHGLSENAHNTWLQLAAETGIPGLLLFVSVYLAFFITALRALPRMKRGFRQAVVMGAVGGAVAQAVSAFGNPSWEFAECSTFLWFVLAVGMVAAGIPEGGRSHRSGGA